MINVKRILLNSSENRQNKKWKKLTPWHLIRLTSCYLNGSHDVVHVVENINQTTHRDYTIHDRPEQTTECQTRTSNSTNSRTKKLK